MFVSRVEEISMLTPAVAQPVRYFVSYGTWRLATVVPTDRNPTTIKSSPHSPIKVNANTRPILSFRCGSFNSCLSLQFICISNFLLAKRSGPCVKFNNMLTFYGHFLGLCQILKLEDHPLSVLHNCLFSIFTDTLRIWTVPLIHIQRMCLATESRDTPAWAVEGSAWRPHWDNFWKFGQTETTQQKGMGRSEAVDTHARWRSISHQISSTSIHTGIGFTSEVCLPVLLLARQREQNTGFIYERLRNGKFHTPHAQRKRNPEKLYRVLSNVHSNPESIIPKSVIGN